LNKKFVVPLGGPIGLKLLGTGSLTFKQIEACRKSIRRNIKKKGRILIRVFPNMSATKKSAGSRMGTGKGAHDKWVCPIRNGRIICDVSGQFSEFIGLKALNSAGTKLPFKTKIVKMCF